MLTGARQELLPDVVGAALESSVAICKTLHVIFGNVAASLESPLVLEDQHSTAAPGAGELRHHFVCGDPLANARGAHPFAVGGAP